MEALPQLPKFYQQLAQIEEDKIFLEVVLPYVATLALQVETLFPEQIPIMK